MGKPQRRQNKAQKLNTFKIIQPKQSKVKVKTASRKLVNAQNQIKTKTADEKFDLIKEAIINSDKNKDVIHRIPAIQVKDVKDLPDVDTTLQNFEKL